VSASKLVTIFCDADGCGTWEDAGVADTAGIARSILKQRGWKVGVSCTDRITRDYCPEHRRGGPA
jgi:hypothetical protein